MGTRVSINKLCRGCMAEIENQDSTCTECGFNKNSFTIDKSKLRVDFILKGQYVVGKWINETLYEVTYIGYNLTYDKKVVIKELFPQKLVSRGDYATGSVDTKNNLGTLSMGKIVDSYVGKARDIIADGGEVEISDAFRENGTAYYVMDCEDKDIDVLKTFTLVDAEEIDSIVVNSEEQVATTRPAFVQPARANNRINLGNAPVVPARGTANSVNSHNTTSTDVASANKITSRTVFVTDMEKAKYLSKDETSLPSLAESNKSAIERENARKNSVFTFTPQPIKVSDDEDEQNKPKSIVISDREIMESINGVNNAERVSANLTSDISYSNASADSRAAIEAIERARSVELHTSSPKKKLSDIKIAGRSITAIISVAVCILIFVLVISALTGKDGESKDTNKDATTVSASTTTQKPQEEFKEEETPITFSNGEFEAAVRKQLGLSDEEPITQKMLEGITSLDLSDSQIADVSDVIYLPELKELNLSGSKVTDINSLSSLTKLEKLNLNRCSQLKDAYALSGLQNLAYVNILGTQIKGDAVEALNNVELVDGRFCTFHLTYVYHRNDNKYKGYSLWSWNGGGDGGSEHEFEKTPDGTRTTTVTYYMGTTNASFKLKYKDWESEKEVDKDRRVQIRQNLEEETIVVYLEQDTDAFKVVYSDESTVDGIVVEPKETVEQKDVDSN